MNFVDSNHNQMLNMNDVINRKRVEQDLDNIVAKNEIRNAVKLNKLLNETFNVKSEPMFFNGKLDAKTVFVMLNPGSPKDIFPSDDVLNKYEKASTRYNNYLDYWINYGSKMTKVDNFDLKQAAFLYSFSNTGIALPKDFLNKSDEVRLEAQRNVLLQKLQIELIPYGSPTFKNHFGSLKETRLKLESISSYVEGVLDAIIAHKRDQIIFGSGQFYNILKVCGNEKSIPV